MACTAYYVLQLLMQVYIIIIIGPPICHCTDQTMHGGSHYTPEGNEVM